MQATSNDMDNAYLTRMKEDGAILITDESTGTYLPGTLNENIKNVTSEPTDALVAAALGLSDLSGLTSDQKLAAKVAYLIYNTTLGSYGTIDPSTTTAIASLYLMDGPGTDADWAGANQVNEIISWLVSGTSINIYLNPDNSLNATGLAATYKLTDPGGTKSTITTSADINGKLYFAFPKSSAVGDYSITLSYAIGGTITSAVPSTATFNYVPVPPLDGTPSISGTMQYGQILTVTPDITNITGITGTLSYIWKANGTVITGATGNTYTLTAGEVGKTISCDITSDMQTGTVSATASGTVAKITLTVTAEAQAKVYGEANPGLTFLYSGWNNSEDETVLDTKPTTGTTVNLLTQVGTHSNTITVSGGVDNCYDFTYVAATFTVTQAMLTVTADAQTKVFGEENDALTFQYSGWKNGNGIADLTTTPTVSTTVTVASPVAVYTGAITVTGGVDENYNFSYIAAEYEVTKAVLTVTADAQTKVFGEANDALTFQYSGWQNGNGVADLTTAPMAGTTVTVTSPVAVYTGAITVSGGDDENFSFSYVAADYEVTKAVLTVTADAKSKVYSEANPDLTFLYSGWVNGVETIDEAPSITTTVDGTTMVGTYTGAITLSGGMDNNYTFSFVAGDLDVTKAVLTATAEPKTKVYGEANPGLTFQYSGWVNGIEAIDVAPSITTTVDGTTVVGTYTDAITLSGGSDNNYTFSLVSGDLEATKAVLTATADNQTKVYGAANPALTFQYSGWVNGVETIDVAPSVTTTVDGTTNVGTHADAITLSGGSDNNYTISLVSGDLEVTKAVLTATADNQTKVYGSS